MHIPSDNNLKLLSYKSKYAIKLFIINLIIFSLGRITILLSNSSYFSKLSVYQTIHALIHGIRFDLSISCMFLALPLLMLTLPIYSKWWVKTWGIFISLAILAFYTLICVDIIFFNESLRHIGNELLLGADNKDFILEALFQYFYYAIPLILLIYFLIKTYVKSMNINSNSRSSIKLFPIKFLFILIFLYFGIFGKIGLKLSKVISTGNAFVLKSVEYGNLVLNGPFTSMTVIRRKKWKNRKKYFSSKDAIQETRALITNDFEIFVDENFPLVRKVIRPLGTIPTNKKYNIFIVALESWSGKYMGMKIPNTRKSITPNFDEIAAKSLQFTNIYPNSGMSLFGISSIMTSFSHLSRNPLLGKGLEVYNIPRVGLEFKKLGYKTFFSQGAVRRSFRMDSISDILEFDEYYGKENYPKIESKDSSSNGWDRELFNFSLSRLDKLNSPFIYLAFTGTTHIPYKVPDKSFMKFSHNSKSTNGFFNTLSYADWSLGNFIKKAEKKKWFKDTIFIFVADHNLNRSVINKTDKIPLLIYAPGIIAPKKNNRLGSQVDIIPTIAHLTGLPIKYSGHGQSLFSKNEPFIVMFNSPDISFRDKNGIIGHNINKKLFSTYKEKEDEVNAENKLLKVEQTIWELIETNRMYPN